MADLKRLLSIAYPYRLRLLLATAFILLNTLANLAIAVRIGGFFDALFVDQAGLLLNRAALLVVGLLLLRLVLSVIYGYLLEWTSERVVVDLRRRLFTSLVHQDMNFFVHTRLGELTSRMTNDVATVQHAVTTTLTGLAERVLMTIGSLTLMLLLNWRLTLAVFVAMPLAVFITRLFGKRVHLLSRAAQERLAAATSVMEETLSAIRVVKIFVREGYEINRFDEEVEAVFEKAQARARLHAVFNPSITLLFMSGLVLVVWIGGREVLAGRLTVGNLIQFLIYSSFISGAASGFAAAYSTFKRSLGASERLFELLALKPTIASPPEARPLPTMRGALEFDRVDFCYEEGYPILADLSFRVSPGELVALVGVSGVGKSTLMDLIPRFYDVTGGCVRVDGVDVREADLPSLRRAIASVPQDTVLFADTVRNNLRYGRLEATDEEVEEAARAANAHEFIQALPLGYDTIVGERGVRLSGGQRQRVAIARALLKEPAILLLDEATSSLDAESERAVQAALDRLLAARGRTTLVIAHRLSTVRNADRILVLAPVDGVGRLVEAGSHEELLRQRGVYYHLYMLQFQEAARHAPEESVRV